MYWSKEAILRENNTKGKKMYVNITNHHHHHHHYMQDLGVYDAAIRLEYYKLCFYVGN